VSIARRSHAAVVPKGRLRERPMFIQGFCPKKEAYSGRRTMKYLLLLIPCLLAIAVPLYNAIEPKAFGFPFFFWFQLLLIPVSSLFILFAFLGDKE
jgi:hypothetical protein